MNFEISEEDFGKRLDIFLQEKLSDFSRSHIQNSIKSEESYILRKGKKLTKSGELWKLGDKVFCVVNPPKQVQIKPEKVAVLEMRTHGAWYLKGLPGGVSVKRKLYEIDTKEEFVSIINDYIDKISENMI